MYLSITKRLVTVFLCIYSDTSKKRKGPEPNTSRSIQVLLWRRWGECQSCIQQFPPRIKVYSLFSAKASPGHFHANRSSLQSRRHDYPTNRLNTSMIIEYSIFAAYANCFRYLSHMVLSSELSSMLQRIKGISAICLAVPR